MKLNEMILVIENNKGTERNALMNLKGFIEFANLRDLGSQNEIMDFTTDLGRTVGFKEEWVETYLASNKTISARFCFEEEQLGAFLMGEFNDSEEFVFDEQLSSQECLDTLTDLGISTRGVTKLANLHYEKIEETYLEGSILHNLNGRDYRVMEKFTERNLLLMDTKSGAMVVAVGVDSFKRYPKGMESTESNTVIGIEWGHGIYLPARPSLIDFRSLKQEYGYAKKPENVTEHRELLKEKFNLYYRVSKDEIATDKLKEAATNSMYEEFGTGRPDTFSERLSDGYYDGAFAQDVKKERAR